MKTRLLAALVAVLSLLVACGPGSVPPPGELVASKSQRISADAPEADVTATVDGTTDFGLAVYRQLGDGNLAFSPYSVVTALAMTYPGAKGDTLTAFEKVLNVSLPQAHWHRAMNTLDRALTSRGAGAQGKDGKPFKLAVNNQAFAQRGFKLLPDYLDLLATEYGSGVRLLDFKGAAEASRQQINSWISTNTAGLIPELLAKGTIDPDTRLTLVNTVYFNAAWKTPFKKESTFTADFTKLDGAKQQVAMMSGEGVTLGHAVVDGVDVLSIPYDGEQVSMLIVMPPVAKFAELEAGLTAARLRTFASEAAAHQNTTGLRMPKFEARTQASLKEVLVKLGLGVAFIEGEADFSGMTGTRELYVAAVIHEAVVKTDEAGTEAAAATAVVMAGRMAMPEFVEVNRPFVYLVRDDATGAVLFMGRVVAP